MEEKSLTKNFAFNFIRTLMSLLFPIVTFSYASRTLKVAGQGQINFARSFITYFTMIAALGIPDYGTREGAKLRHNKARLSRFAHEMIGMNLVATTAAYLLLGIALLTVPKLQEYRDILLLFGISIGMTGMGMEWLYQALEEYRYITLRTAAFQLAGIVLMFLLVKDEKDTQVYAAISVFASAGACLLNFINARTYISFRQQNVYSIRRHIIPVTTLFAFSVSTKLYTSMDATMLGLMSDNTSVGLYGAGIKINKMTVALITSLGAVLMPRLSYYLETGERERFNRLVDKAYHFIFLFSVPCAAGLFILSEEIVILLSGSGYEKAVLTMRLLTPLVLVIPFSILTNNQILIPMRKERLILISTAAGAGIDFIGNCLLIPRFSENGAAVATVITEFVVAGICFYNGKKLFPIERIFGQYWKYWVSVLPLVFIICMIKTALKNELLILLLSAASGALSYFFILAVLKESCALELLQTIRHLYSKRKETHRIK